MSALEFPDSPRTPVTVQNWYYSELLLWMFINKQSRAGMIQFATHACLEQNTGELDQKLQSLASAMKLSPEDLRSQIIEKGLEEVETNKKNAGGGNKPRK